VNAGVRTRDAESGFTMVEMLMVLAVMAIGLLGLAALQTMSLRVARSGRNLASAVKVGERILDQVELEGRLTWLNTSASSESTPSTIANLTYINLDSALTLRYDANGDALPSAAGAFFTITVDKTDVEASSSFSGQAGALSDYTVVVAYPEAVDSAGTRRTRKVTLVRRILHA
jgi:prepilin-type N-terminal cleavage/methylation domain-containing protein